MQFLTQYILRPYVGYVQKEALDNKRYIDNCLTELQDLNQQHHSKNKIMLWLDLESYHLSLWKKLSL